MSQEPEHAAASHHHQVKTILIVEDDVDIGELIVQAITQETPYMAMLVTNAMQALQAVKSLRPNLFLLDYNLPLGMDGLDLYDHLRTTEGFTDVPIVLMTAAMPKKQTERRHLLRLHKPFELDELLATIDELLS